MKRILYSIFAVAAVFTACTKDGVDTAPQTPAPSEKDGFVTLTFAASIPETKTTLGDKQGGVYPVSWEAGDQIAIHWILDGTAGSTTCSATTSGSTTTFVASVPDGVQYYAVYPATLNVTLDDNSFSVNVPHTVDGTFKDANVMAAKAVGTTFHFKNVGGILKFRPGASGWDTGFKFRAVASGKINGPVGLTFGSDGSIESYDVSASSGTFNSYIWGALNASTDYYIPLRPGIEITEFAAQAKLADPATTSCAYWKGSYTTARSRFWNLGSVAPKLQRDFWFSASGSDDSPMTQANPGSLAQARTLLSAATIFNSMRLNGSTLHFLAGTYSFSEPITIAPVAYDSGYYPVFSIVGEGVGDDGTIFDGGEASSFFTINTGSKFTAEKINFTHGAAANGAALSIGDDKSTDDNLFVTFRDCKFDSNKADTHGGAILIPAAANKGGIAAFDNCLFNANVATAGSGGVAYTASGTVALFFNKCTFTGNTGKANAHTIYMNNSSARLAMNCCTVNAGNFTRSNGAAITCKGHQVLANSTFWSSKEAGKWGTIALGMATSTEMQNAANVVNCVIRNNSETYGAFYFHVNYYQNVNWCLFTGSTGDNSNSTVASSVDLGLNGTFASPVYKDATVNGIAHKYYYFDYSSTLEGKSFTKPTLVQVRSSIAATGESSTGAADGLGQLFLNWLDTINGALSTDIAGNARPKSGLCPGSAEL